MSPHLWAPVRPQPVPVTGMLFSLTAHGALLAAVVGVGPSVSADAEADDPTPGTATYATSDRERLHWVGVGTGPGGQPWRAGTPPPIAYVVPGRGDHRLGALRSSGLTVRTSAGEPARTRARDARAGGSAGPTPAPEATRATAPRRRPRAVRIPALPELAMLDAQATLLVAGVLSASPDLARRAAPPADFVPAPEAELLHGRPAKAGALALRVSSLRVDVLPIPLVSNPPPSYPDQLERAGVDGRVVVEFVIDSTGLVDLASLRVVQSTNTLFTQAVRRVLPALRFVPAQLGEQAIGVTVQQPFLFTMRARR